MPRLQFNNISLGVAHVAEREPASAGNIDRDNLAIIAAASRHYFLAFLLNIRNFKGDMRKARPRDFRPQNFFAMFEFENLQSRAALAVPGQTQMPSTRV